MDLIALRIAATVLSFVVFLGILVWAYGRGRHARFAEDALIPFREDEAPRAGPRRGHLHAVPKTGEAAP